MDSSPKLTLAILPSEYAICRLAPTDAMPEWFGADEFTAAIRTVEELAIVCPAHRVPTGAKHESGWRLMRLEGAFAFTEIGILVSVLQPLASAKISILALSTFDTDFILIKEDALTRARGVLAEAGHEVRP
jgi:uncharacterized protein